MLPSSHQVPIIASLPEFCSVEQPKSRFENQPGNQQAQSLLADAFSEFIASSGRLENSYRELQQEVSELAIELADRNAALNTSLADNERMRLALEQIVDSMPCGVMVLDRDGTISMINPESERLLGLDPEYARKGISATLRQISAVSGVNLESFYQNETSSRQDAGRDASRDNVQEFCVRSDSTPGNGPRDGLRDGKRWLEIRNRGIFTNAGRERDDDAAGPSGGEKNISRPDQTILILRDITAQKRAEQEREAGRKAMALAEITTVLAHEIRNPLASLELFAGLLETDDDRARRGEWISNLRAGIRSLAGTVNNVLSFHGSGSLPLAPLPLAVLIGNAIEFVQPLAEQAAVKLQWLGESDREGTQILVMGNESALQQVVLNLVANAIRHTAAGGSITVSLRTEDTPTEGRNRNDLAILEFCDTGCGIRPEQLTRVFEPGFSGNGDSSGLGLAVCARIMKQHGGQISVTSRVHRGSQFRLDFPVLQMELATA